MGTSEHRRHSSIQYRLFAAMSLFVAAYANAYAGSYEQRHFDGVRMEIDNDLFAVKQRDRDYTGGFSLTVSGRTARDSLLSLDPVLDRLNRLTLAQRGESNVRHARQIGLIAFTPANTLAAELLPDDRPYANLLFLANGRVRVDADGRGAWSSSITLGMLGLPLMKRVHDAVHEIVGSAKPRGYDHQISAGGEPAARYTVARQHLWVANSAANMDVKTTVQGSVGYLTAASAAITVRLGRFSTAWWSFAPELADYAAAPVPVATSRHALPEAYLFSGIRLQARLYNVFLQGQFRGSELRYSASEVEPLVAIGWIGMVTEVFEQTMLSYTLNYQTAEVRRGDAARDACWGAVQLTHAF